MIDMGYTVKTQEDLENDALDPKKLLSAIEMEL